MSPKKKKSKKKPKRKVGRITKPLKTKKTVKKVLKRTRPRKKVVKRAKPKRVVKRKIKIFKGTDKLFPVVSVFGHRINPRRIRDAAIDVHRKKALTTDDIHVEDFIRDENYDNLMVKIAILDHIEEQAAIMYRGENITRKNRLALEMAK